MSKHIVLKIPYGENHNLKVAAEIVGAFGIHKGYRLEIWENDSTHWYSDYSYTVTHILTGLCIARYRFKKDAIQYAKTISSQMDFDALITIIAERGSVSRADKQKIKAIKQQRDFGSYIIPKDYQEMTDRELVAFLRTYIAAPKPASQRDGEGGGE